MTGPDPSRPANNAPPRAVVLLSGGLDSAACLAIARSEGCEVFALSIDYGQRHRHELIAAANIARALGAAEHRVVSLDLRAIGGSALTSDTPVPKREHDAQHAVPGESAARPHAPPATDIPVTYVPARNLTFLSLCLGYAEVIGARELWIGVNAVDYSGYPDCRPAFIDAFERVANLATREGVLASEAAHGSTNSSSSTPAAPHFHVRTPLIDLTKAQIIRRGHELGVDFAMTHSCYDPVTTSNADALACGHCDSCIIRRRGFEGAGLPDPTRYADAKP